MFTSLRNIIGALTLSACLFGCSEMALNHPQSSEEISIASFASYSIGRVEASKLTASATALSDDGNVASNTTDGSLSTRWSANGSGEYITYNLGNEQNIDYVKIAFFKGNERSTSFAILAGNSTSSLSEVYNGSSSGNTTSLETFDLSNVSAQHVRVVGYENSSNTWNSLTETEIYGTEVTQGGGDTGAEGELSISSVNASSDDGNVANNTTDGDLNTRWSANGSGEYITYDLGSAKTVGSLKIAFFKGNERSSNFAILTGASTSNLSEVYNSSSSGNSTSLEDFDFADVSARYVRIVGYGNSANTWNSITETEIYGADGSGDTGNGGGGDDTEGALDNVADIQDAIQNAQPGDVIKILAGTYTGNGSDSGNSNAYFYGNLSSYHQQSSTPVTIKGVGGEVILQGSSNSSKNGLHLLGGTWIVKDISIQKAKKGLMLDASIGSTIDNITVSNIGEEGIHLRDGTSSSVVKNCTVTDCGNLTVKYGEGIYVGSDSPKWTEYGGNYDKNCNDNIIQYNTIGPNVTAEHIDVKEGVQRLIIEHNTFNGAGISDQTNGGLSFIDVKGNYTIVRNNVAYQQNNSLLYAGFEVHSKLSGAWGQYTTFSNNTINFDNGNSSAYALYSNTNALAVCIGSGNTRYPSSGSLLFNKSSDCSF